MLKTEYLQGASAAFRLMIATSWLAPDLWQKKQEDAIREAVGAGPAWTEYLGLVDRHRTPALSWAALSRVPGITVPESARQELQNRSDACRSQAVRHCLLLAEVLKGFNRAGIPAMPFKGQILSYELYGDVGLRSSRDLDLAVPREHLARAQNCLENLGWGLDSTWFPLSPGQWERCLGQEHHLGFIHSNAGCILELHWRSELDSSVQTSARWARSIPSVWQGCPFQAMNPIDQALYLCSHGGEHAWFRAKWLGDLARVYAAGQVDWEAALGEARRTGQERALLAGLRILDLVYGLPLPGLPGNPWKELPPLLIEMPLHALKDPEEPAMAMEISMASIRNRLHINHYERLLLPRKGWRDSLSRLLYHREDFRVLHLPDGLCWAYAPLHPILWVWRWARQSSRGITSVVSLKPAMRGHFKTGHRNWPET
jgi:hypothetical protein